jgi:chaperonin cofactor prefoldin
MHVQTDYQFLARQAIGDTALATLQEQANRIQTELPAIKQELKAIEQTCADDLFVQPDGIDLDGLGEEIEKIVMLNSHIQDAIEVRRRHQERLEEIRQQVQAKNGKLEVGDWGVCNGRTFPSIRD